MCSKNIETQLSGGNRFLDRLGVFGVLSVEFGEVGSRQFIKTIRPLARSFVGTVELGEMLNDGFAVAAILVMHEKPRESRSLSIVLGQFR